MIEATPEPMPLSITLDARHPTAFVWAAWLETKAAEPLFLYACCAPCERSVTAIQAERLPLLPSHDGTQRFLAIRHVTLDIGVVNGFIETLASTAIAELPMMLGEGAPSPKIALTRRVLGKVFGHHAAAIDAYLTLPDLGNLLPSVDPLAPILRALQAQLGIRFTKEYASHLGNVEIFHLAPWLERRMPFSIEVPRADKHQADGRHRLVIARAPDFAKDAHIAHVQCFSGDDVTLDRLCHLASSDEGPCEIVAPASIDGFEFRLFSGDGARLLHKETTHFLLQINMVTSAMGRSVGLDDKLSAAAETAGRNASTVRAHSSSRSRIGLDGDEDRWRGHAAHLERYVAEHFAPASRDRWFPRAVESQIEVIEHINSIVHGGYVSAAILVDPFFGADALTRLAMRLSSTDVALTVITCLRDKDNVPDSGRRFTPASRALSVLQDTVGRFHMLINPKLTILNLERSGDDQVFHDRYLLTYPYEGPATIYMLSNSINKMAGNHPFCMSVLAEDITRGVQEYIEALSRGQDISHPTQPRITFAWPPR